MNREERTIILAFFAMIAVIVVSFVIAESMYESSRTLAISECISAGNDPVQCRAAISP